MVHIVSNWPVQIPGNINSFKMNNVNPNTCFELDALLADLKQERFRKNDLSFFKRFQRFVENESFRDGSFLVGSIFRQGNSLYPQWHNDFFCEFLKRRKGDFVNLSSLEGVKIKKKIGSLSEEKVRTLNVAMNEDQFLSLVFALFMVPNIGQQRYGMSIDREAYNYFYVTLCTGTVAKFWVCLKGDKLDCKGSLDLKHTFNADTLMYLE